MKDARRVSLAVVLSVVAHGAVVALVLASSLLGTWRSAPVDVEITGMKMDDLTDLPLGTPAPGAAPEASPAPPVEPTIETPETPSAAPGPPRPRKPKVKAPPPLAESTPDAGAASAPPRPQSVRAYGPEGSRVTALLRIDRLRDTPYTSAVDALLMRLPDRRDLLEGTEIDLYRDVDAVLIATPNPMDPAVTFLAVRHHLTDTALREALERGARATGRTLKWRSERGRPFAERHAAATARPPDPSERRHRDERLIVLATPRLVVVTPPAYRSLILRGRPASPAAGPEARSAGAEAPDGAAASTTDATAGESDRDAGAGAGANPAPNEHADWAALVRRIDAEDSIMPEDAVVMVSAEDVFVARGFGDQVAGTRGSPGDDDDGRGTARQRRATALGMPMPRLITATLGIAPAPFSDVDATFFDESDALRWENEWPGIRRKLLSSPLVVLTGFSSLVGRLTLSREGVTVHVHVQATQMEMIRILQVIVTQVMPRGG